MFSKKRLFNYVWLLVLVSPTYLVSCHFLSLSFSLFLCCDSHSFIIYFLLDRSFFPPLLTLTIAASPKKVKLDVSHQEARSVGSTVSSSGHVFFLLSFILLLSNLSFTPFFISASHFLLCHCKSSLLHLFFISLPLPLSLWESPSLSQSPLPKCGLGCNHPSSSFSIGVNRLDHPLVHFLSSFSPTHVVLNDWSGRQHNYVTYFSCTVSMNNGTL